MRYRLLACWLAFSALALGQTKLTVDQLVTFVKNEQQFIKEGRSTDKQLANYLAGVKLTQKLDGSVIEDLQSAGVGPLTLKALEKLRTLSQNQIEAHYQQPLPDDPIPPPTSLEQGQILDAVRDYVMNYDSGLPDFICLEVETRRAAPRPGGHYGGRVGDDPEYQTQDVITSKLTYFEHQEKKTPILNGNRPINTAYENLGGSTSTGDFGTMLRELFEPATQARFEWSHWATLRGRLTMAFSYRVDQARSHFSIRAKDVNREIVPAYTGEVFVDNESRKVTRLTMKAEDIPADFPVKDAQELLDYQYEDVGGTQFLLPSRGEVRMDGAEVLSDNILEYRFYRKYEVGSSISFDMSDVGDAKPADQETKAKPPAVDCKDPKNKDAPECKAPVVKKN